MRVFATLNGASFRPKEAQEAVLDLVDEQSLSLRRDADNPYDENAVAVYSGPLHLGFIERVANADIAAHLDRGGEAECHVHMIVEGSRSASLKPLLRVDFE